MLDQPNLKRTFTGQARFAIDHDALLAFLKELKPNRSKGPAASRPRLTPTAKALLENELKRRIPSQATGDQLRTLLLEAGKAMGDGQFKTAMRKFRAARMLCHLSGLTEEEVATSIAAGTAALAAHDKRAALLAFRAAKSIALAAKLPLTATQAELGIAAAHWFTRDFHDARASYAEVTRLAESSPALRLEAMRMQAECFVMDEQPSEAIATYGAVLDAAERLAPGLRRTTSFPQAGKSFAALLETLGQTRPARDVEARVLRIEADGPAPSGQEVAS